MWVVVRGGLGNQMFQAAKGIALARTFDMSPRFVDLTTRSDAQRKWELGVFGIKAAEPGALETLLIETRLRLSKKFRRYGVTRAFGVLNETPPPQVTPDPPRAPVVVNGFWQHPRHFAAADGDVRAAFCFPDHPAVEAFARTVGVGGSVAIHVRRGDYVSNPAASGRHLVCDSDWYRRAWDRMQADLGACRAYVFSDEPDWARNNLGLTGDVTVVNGAPDDPSWVDMARMARCNHFVISNSSYSWWAAHLSEFEQKRVLAPRQWFVGVDTRDIGICPRDWILM
ncbi:MAG: hypothetical protein B7Y80_14385 [Hyphomicrobium sp. 32-62-53]|nr:MAG: hypothetical protein B7Z29_16090 [Hyphomicrobium sp. 12-62-95]OYX98677.1 MAG: hypothetical protein B7Y80_14385 [Hyphomicrobium sp. 32-62-53]